MKPRATLRFLTLIWLAACLPAVGTPAPAGETAVMTTPTDTPQSTLTTSPAATETAEPSPTPYPPEIVRFYRLRIEFTTTSDWSTLELLTPDYVLTIKEVELSGSPTYHEAGIERLALNQPLPTAEAGNEVGMTVEFAIAPEAVEQPFEFRLKRGALNASVIKFSDATGEALQLIDTITHDRVIQSDPAFNAIEFALDLSQLAGEELQVTQLITANRQKTLWAFYYPWYSRSDWVSESLQDRPVTPYASSDESAIDRHIEQAQRAGIDGFISSWWGPDSDTDRNLRKLLTIARERNFWVTIYFETLAGENGNPLSGEKIHEWLAYAISQYRDEPAFYKLEGKPLIVVWASGSVPLETWRQVFARLDEEGLEAVYLAMGYNLASLDVFDGLHDYGVFLYPDLAKTYQSTGRAVRYYPLLGGQGAAKIWAATVQPGYDDTLLPGREGLVQEREEGAFYRSTFEAAIQSDPDFIFITTWNEWWEHTYIEPSELYGDLYLQITREYAERWKGQ